MPGPRLPDGMPSISAPSRLLVLALPVSHPDPTLAGQFFWLVVCRREHKLPTRVSVDQRADHLRRRSLDPGRGPIPDAGKSNRCGARAKVNELVKVLACMRGSIAVACSCPALLVYAFLLDLMQPPWEGTRDWIMHFWCRRTGAQDPSHPRALHAPAHRPQSTLDGLSPFHLAPRPFFPWRCLPPLTRFGMKHVSIYAD